MQIEFVLNGARTSLDVEPRTLLVQLLRDELGLTGTKVGCDTSQCGACTVLLDGRAVKSCTILAVRVNAAEVRTIEGLAGAEGAASRLQDAFAEHHGLQCGFCTPGMIMAAADLLGRNPAPTERDVRRAIAGNICRCTGYQQIVTSILAAGAPDAVAS